MLEVEVKFKIDDLDEMKRIVEEAGFVFVSSMFEMDSYYNSEFNDLKKMDRALRIRTTKDLFTDEVICTMNSKGPKIDHETMTREEIEFELPEGIDGNKFLEGLGYFIKGSVEKIRKYYKKNNILICIDSVTNLGDFVELEILSNEENYDLALAKLKENVVLLGLDWEQGIQKSYLSMLEEK